MDYEPDEAAKIARTMTGPLAPRLALIAADFRNRLVDYSAAIDRAVARLQAGGAVFGAPNIGDTFPDFILPDAKGQLWRLETALQKGPVVLVFHRGYWCDFCHLNMAALAEISPKVAALNCQIVAISPQNAVNAGKLARDAGADFQILCDIDLGISTLLGLSYVIDDELFNQLACLQIDLDAENAGNGHMMPITATFVLNGDGVIVARHLDPDPRIRMEGDAILQAAAEIQLAARS